MTIAADLRADAYAVLIGESQGIVVTVQNPPLASGATLDPSTGDFVPSGSPPAPLTGFGRVGRFSDALAAGGLIQEGDRLVIFYPDTVPGLPAIEGVVTITNADGSTETARVVGWTTRELGGEVVHHRIQARK